MAERHSPGAWLNKLLINCYLFEIMKRTLFLKSFIILTITTLLLCDVGYTRGFPVGFSMFNQRNHPELEWKSAETKHFIISYPAHLAGIEAQAAAIAEATYEALSENMDVRFDYKIRINLSDEDEIMNGFAVPFPRAYTNIWVNLNQVAEGWSGREKWLRTVIAHELAHIFHFEAVKSNLRLPGLLPTAAAMPVPWTEGVAQYFTEPWHALRGDHLLRQAFYDGRPSYEDGTSIRNTALMYAAGNAQMRYFSAAYGDSLLPEILAHRQKSFGGLIRVHNFDKAFKEVTGKKFSDFEDEWRRHKNIYYHSLAAKMERSDSLGSDPEKIPGLFIQDVQYSPDTSMIAVISLVSMQRPYQQLAVIENDSLRRRNILWEGSFLSPLSWSPDGEKIAYAAPARGKHGSILNDIYLIDVKTGSRERITHSARAAYPVFSPDGLSLYHVVNESGTGNVFALDLNTGDASRITLHTGDVQIGRLAMHPEGTHLAFLRFDADGSRHIVVLNLENGEERILTDGDHDDRHPLWSPDGRMLAYTSLRDYVPNVFLMDPFADHPSEERITSLFAGATALQWLPPDSLNERGRLVIATSDTKRDNEIYIIDAGRRKEEPVVDINPAYTEWLTHKPPSVIPTNVAPDESLIIDRYEYNSWKNISHAATLPFPYFTSSDDFGLGVISLFSEPLSKHMFTMAAAVSFREFRDNSLFFFSYINNQFKPSLSINLYHNSFTGRFFERDYLVTTNSGAYLLATLPRDWIDNTFVNSTLYGRFRYEYTDANRFWEEEAVFFSDSPQDGWQQDFQMGLRISKQKPFAHNLIHPLDGWGFETRITVASRLMGGETEYIRPDIQAYRILPGGGNNRFFLFGRAIAQWGDAFPQDYIGLSRYDDIRFGNMLPGLEFLYTDTERVRGYRDYASGDRLLFGTLEYRMPFMESLQTRILGLVSLGRTSLTAFIDGGLVWSDEILPGDDLVKRAGTGLELKNVISIGGLQLVHSLGAAQSVREMGRDEDVEVYYRVRAVIPF